MSIKTDRRDLQRTAPRRMDSFIPAEEAYKTSFFARFEREVERLPATTVCICKNSNDLKARYLELRKISEDNNLTAEQRKKILDEATEVLDDLMRQSKYYDDFKRARYEATHQPELEVVKEKYTFKGGLPPEQAKKYRRF